jgi:hypothetical protein
MYSTLFSLLMSLPAQAPAQGPQPPAIPATPGQPVMPAQIGYPFVQIRQYQGDPIPPAPEKPSAEARVEAEIERAMVPVLLQLYSKYAAEKKTEECGILAKRIIEIDPLAFAKMVPAKPVEKAELRMPQFKVEPFHPTSLPSIHINRLTQASFNAEVLPADPEAWKKNDPSLKLIEREFLKRFDLDKPLIEKPGK